MIIAFIGGLLLGIFFFGGLYWTTNTLPKVRHPALLMILSMVVRMVVLLIGLYYLMNDRYQNILIALLGIIIIRFVLVFKFKNKGHTQYP